jgi:hypothetical protein
MEAVICTDVLVAPIRIRLWILCSADCVPDYLMRGPYACGDFMRDDYMSGDTHGDYNVSRVIWYDLISEPSVVIASHSRFLHRKSRVHTLA